MDSRPPPGGGLATWLGAIAIVIIFVASILVAARSEAPDAAAQGDHRGSAIAARPL